MNNIRWTMHGKTAALDGYLEILLGTFAIAGLIVRYDVEKTTDGEETVLFIQTVLRDPPLGHVGMKDIPERKGSASAADGGEARKYGDDF